MMFQYNCLSFRNVTQHSVSKWGAQLIMTNGIAFVLPLVQGIDWHMYYGHLYMGADKSLDWSRMKQATVTEDFDVYVSYL
jgi:hypothetical protein